MQEFEPLSPQIIFLFFLYANHMDKHLDLASYEGNGGCSCQ
jgi:hypothetical protein